MFVNYPIISRVLIVLIDTMLTVVSFAIALSLRKYFGFSHGVQWQIYLNVLLIILIVWRILSGYQEAYASKVNTSLRSISSFTSTKEDIVIVIKTAFWGCLIIYILSLFIEWPIPKSLILFFGIINVAFLSAEKVILYQLINYDRRRKTNIKRLLILGVGDIAKIFIKSVKDDSRSRIKILGLVSREENYVGEKVMGYKVMGYWGNLENILHSVHIDELVVALSAKYFGDIEEIIVRCDKEGIPVRIISPFFNKLISKSRIEILNGIPVIIFMPVERNDLEMAVKRIIDMLFSFIALIALAPLFVLIAIIIKIDSPGPIFYKWKIIGLNKQLLTSYKFRTMVQNADKIKEELMNDNEMSGAAFKMKDDPRVTKVGRWLRKYSMDELPQFWSVLKGDLSLVGPRPPLQTEVEKYEGWHRRKLSVKPGITCLWQISGRNEISDFDEWMELDLKYIDEWSLWLDIKILMKTFPAVLKGSGH